MPVEVAPTITCSLCSGEVHPSNGTWVHNELPTKAHLAEPHRKQLKAYRAWRIEQVSE